MADPRAVLVLLIIFFVAFSPDASAPTLQSRNRLEDILAKEEHALAALNTTRYGDFEPLQDRWLNISGFGNETQYSWAALDKVKERARQLSIYALGAEEVPRLDGPRTGEALSLYSNVTGVAHGKWTRSALSEIVKVPQLNLTEYAPEGPFGPAPITSFGRNITSETGDLKVRLDVPDGDETAVKRKDADEMDVDVVRKVAAQVTVGGDGGSGDGFEIQMHGVYFLDTGNAILATTSDK